MKYAGVLAIALAGAGLAAVAAAGTAPSSAREHQVVVDTREGTWLNLDVSPDGRALLFDLLGDIFVLPIEGGEARAIFSGGAWDALPRFSPDGRQIAFISDRSGADNVWIADASGANPRQISDEQLRSPASPVWSPDGRYLAVRKHYTAREPVGAGEIWMYPTAGGDAQRLVESPTTNTDLNEPFFSPDGRFVYYSEDVWPGGATYKNPHATIYAIKRFELQSRQSTLVVAGSGGAVRPTPSPDGKLLAYVRRQGGNSALVLRQIDSGAERVLFDGLDRDLQEIWALHGLYPAFAWLPGSRELVIWSNGGLLRIEVDSGKTAGIPFHVRQSFPTFAPSRPAVEVAPAKFPVKLLSWASVSPNGRRLVFQALGHIYIRDLPHGRARRLTADDDRFEFHPVLSPDGEWIVYTTWSDTQLGSVRRTRIGDGKTIELTRRPGHYFEPAVSPDGRHVVFRRGAGGGAMPHMNTLVTSDWGSEPGLYSIAWEGGGQTLIAADGARPQFCAADPDHVFVMRHKPRTDKPPAAWWNSDRILTAIDMRSGAAEDRATAAFATEFRLSPDCRWLARVERSEIRVTAFAGGSSLRESGMRTDGAEDWQAPGLGGAFLSWSQDGRLHWLLGAQLVSWRVSNHGRLIGTNPEETTQVREVGFEMPHDRPSGKVALINARIISFDAAGIVEHGSLIVEGNRILAVGSATEIAVPADARVVDLAGGTVIPGLFDLHWHGAYASELTSGMTPQQNWRHFNALAFGVTTIFDPYGADYSVFAAAELGKAGLATAPRIFSTGAGLDGADKDESVRIDTYDDALRVVRRKKALGAIGVKSYLLPRREQQRYVIEAARAEKMLVPAEAAMAQPKIMAQVMDGHTSIEHNLSFAKIYDDVIQLWSQTDVGSTPTLVAAMGGLAGDQYWYQHTDVWRQPLLQKYVPPTILRSRAIRATMADDADQNLLLAARAQRKLHDAGVRTFLGAHGMREGLAAHWEMWSLALGGMRAEDVLRAATLDSARQLGMSADLGTLAPGKLADLVVLDADPLIDIRNTQRIRYVMANGRLYDSSTMNEVGGKVRKPFFWESAERIGE